MKNYETPIFEVVSFEQEYVLVAGSITGSGSKPQTFEGYKLVDK